MYELHLHLEGSIFPEAVSLMEKRRPIAPMHSTEQCKRNSFFQQMNYSSKELLTSVEDYIDTFHCLCKRLQKTHKYVEITLSPGAYDFYHNGDFEEIIARLSIEAQNLPDIRVFFLIELLRNSGPDKCWQQLDAARRFYDSNYNVVGITIAGDEVAYPTCNYIDHIRAARTNGIPITVHAGEWGTADDVWIAIEAGANRIGHGIRSVDDPMLLQYLCAHGIPLEICPTSNIRTGASIDLSEIRTLAAHSVSIIVNTDDPAVFGITLAHEIELVSHIAPAFLPTRAAEYIYEAAFLSYRQQHFKYIMKET